MWYPDYKSGLMFTLQCIFLLQSLIKFYELPFFTYLKIMWHKTVTAVKLKMAECKGLYMYCVLEKSLLHLALGHPFVEWRILRSMNECVNIGILRKRLKPQHLCFRQYILNLKLSYYRLQILRERSSESTWKRQVFWMP